MAYTHPWIVICYRPQQSWAKVMFLQASVILSMGGGLPQCMLGYHHHHPPGADTPHQIRPPTGSRHPPQTRPPSRHPPWSRHPPTADSRKEADSGIRSTSGRYASYWNAFLYPKMLLQLPFRYICICTSDTRL